MSKLLSFVLCLGLASAAMAQDESAVPADSPADEGLITLPVREVAAEPDLTLDEFLWTARPVVVFADSPADPAFRLQMELLLERPEALVERDVVVIVDTDPAGRSALRLKLRPRGFMLVIIGKDGEVELRKPAPWDVREISRTIDKMPLRQQEIRDRSLSGD